jgi:hypothetical protein
VFQKLQCLDITSESIHAVSLRPWRMADSSSMRHCTSIAAWRIAVPAGTLLLPWG